jgi:hypothetical protein
MDGHLFLKGQLNKSLKWSKKYPKGSVGRKNRRSRDGRSENPL